MDGPVYAAMEVSECIYSVAGLKRRAIEQVDSRISYESCIDVKRVYDSVAFSKSGSRNDSGCCEDPARPLSLARIENIETPMDQEH